ncbi:hypothetical protein BT96DRAFT_1003817 [Gymnopus androsaceus JB14]|uniref:Uncharacterized protein n=1 Tax=Gymnopus androsaceus JB14 TaxID=1447944 RepID=A0A6A4GTS4_9AGAR|nr:hypothetical protein BT96DRAFT_1003817 [Gymnopus androsaceus JB14]
MEAVLPLLPAVLVLASLREQLKHAFCTTLLPTSLPTSSSTSAPTLSPQVASVAPSPISRITPPLITSTPSSTAGSSLGTLPHPPSSSISAPAALYNSMYMLQSVAQGSSSMPQSALGGFASGQRSGIANLVSQRLNSSCSNQAQRDHANAVLLQKRSKATSKPSLTGTYCEPQVEDCIDTAALPTGKSTLVINLSLQGRLSFPGRGTRIDLTYFDNLAVKDRHQDPTSIRTSVAEFGLGTEILKQEHKCLSIRTYATFREDHDALLPEGYQNLFLEEGPDGQSVDVLCDEQGCVLIDENLIDENNVMAHYFTIYPMISYLFATAQDQDNECMVQQALISPNLPAAQPLSANASNSVTSTSMLTTSGQSNHHRHATPLDTETLGCVASLSYGVGILWSTPWTPPTQRHSTFYNFNRTDTFYAENKNAYLQTNGEEIDAPSLHLAAPNVQLLTNLFIAEQYMDEPAQWFAPSTDLGSLIALNLIYGFPPIPLNPLLLEYLLNEGDINSLSKDKVLKYFPDLANLLLAWVDMSHTNSLDGNLFSPHFATYHNLQILTLSQRDVETHHVMAFRMLHNSIIGKLGIDCQELQAFLKGFQLPVPGGLTFPEIARSYLYGSRAFIAKAYNFIETFEDLSLNLEISFDHLNPADESHLINALDSAPQPYTQKTFEFILKDFLEATGIPCPTLFHSQVKGRISPIVPLSEAETLTFHLCLFTWAIGGAPFLRAGTQTTMEFCTQLPFHSYSV